ncbi:MAG: hypothetical protein HON98_05160 [Chloroflexi bacterium]|nr:hypothetical protein [Chloroflexota bacterium]MBT3670218.1 hypothetical protein [Chloroflexota bacterium]MBT4003748.1 hypothetical protein [Chloroflexota bacterium]MBT4306108.1 hypothetical protein [Chloroflexota bacterium]MBT4534488.1 hypothetical protein [Chloroflexota bacterium]
MSKRKSLTFGVLLILVGAWFMAVQFVPGLEDWFENYADWPFWVIGPGVVFLAAAVISGVTALVIPGSIISGIGGLLYYQNQTGDWESWSYAWTLIIGFVGIGVFLKHLLDGNIRKAFKEGGDTMLTSAVMFLIFGSFMRYFLGEEPFFGDYWPALIIIWGVWLLIRPSFRSKKPKIEVNIDFADDGEVVDLDMVDEDEDLMDIDDELKEFDS